MIGTSIGHIRIEERIGAGGMGTVFRGFDEALHRRVAVKTLRADRRLSPEAKARFLREARLLSKLDHPSICRIYDLLEGEHSDFLVLEYLEGSTLRALAESAPLDHERALRLALQIAEALEAAHREHIVHRDLKPENVMVDSNDRVKVLDFGIARSADAPLRVTRSRSGGDSATRPREAPSPETTVDMEADDYAPRAGGAQEVASLYTLEGHILGTARYMSPEQAGGGEVSEASDIFSFGVMLQEMLTGKPAYGDTAGADLLLKVFRAETSPVEGVDPDLARLVGDMERVDPTVRPAAAAVAARLRWILTKPERARARRLRIALGIVAAVIVATAAAITVQARLAAGQKARIAQRFAATAEDIDWSLRAEYLSPFHDVQPAISRMRRKMSELEGRITELGALAAGPGAFALGRGYMALGDLEVARAHLERAWNSGYQDAKVALALGTVLGQLYKNAVAVTGTIGDPELRQQAVERIRESLSVPARSYLERCRGADLVSPEYLEGLMAMHEDDVEGGISALSGAAENRPWFYEDDLLLGDLHILAAVRAHELDADAAARKRHWEQAEQAYRRAAETGRSLPWARLGICTAQTFALRTAVVGENRSVPKELVARVAGDCDQALELNPDLALALIRKAELQLVAAVLSERSGDDAEVAYAETTVLVDRALAMAPDDWQVLSGAGYVTKYVAWQQNQRGQDARQAIARCIDIHTRLLGLSPDPVSTRDSIAESYWLAALHEDWYGDDPLPLIEKGIAVIEEGIPEKVRTRQLFSTLGNLYWLLGSHQTSLGIDSTDANDRAIDAFERAAESSTEAKKHRALALAHLNKAEQLLATGKDPSASCDAVIRAAKTATELNPDSARALAAKAAGHFCHARWAHANGEELGENIDRAVALLEFGVKRWPNDVVVHYDLADSLLLRAASERRHGRSPMESVRLARRSIARAADLNPTVAQIPIVASQIELEGARWLATHEPERAGPPFAESIGRAEQAVAAQEGYPFTHLCLARSRFWRAWWRNEIGSALQEDLAGALASADRALELQADFAEAHAVRARIFALQATLDGGGDAGAENLDEARKELAQAIELLPTIRLEAADLVDSIGLPEIED